MRGLIAVLASAALFTACDDDGSSAATDSTLPADRGIAAEDARVNDAVIANDMGDADVADDMGVDAGETGTVCDRQSNFGMKAPALAAITAPEGRYNPQVVWQNEQWGVSWLGPADANGHHALYFGRFDGAGAPLGEPLSLGETGSSQHVITGTGSGFVVLWFNGRASGDPYDGLRFARFDAEGQLIGEATNIPSEPGMGTTYNALQIAVAWAPLAGGMVLYTRGRQHGEEGLFAVGLDEAGAASAPIKLSDGPVDSPSVVYGDGVWGAAWLDRSSANPADVVFVMLNDQGQTVSTERRLADAGAQGSTHLAYGRATFGLAWSKNFLGQLKPFITLFDSGGDILAAGTPLEGPEGFAVVSDAAFLPPDVIGVAWQDSTPDGQRVGISRFKVEGRALDPFTLPDDGSARLAPALGGTLSKIGFWVSTDPNPAPAGGYSEETFVELHTLGPCR